MSIKRGLVWEAGNGIFDNILATTDVEELSVVDSRGNNLLHWTAALKDSEVLVESIKAKHPKDENLTLAGEIRRVFDHVIKHTQDRLINQKDDSGWRPLDYLMDSKHDDLVEDFGPPKFTTRFNEVLNQTDGCELPTFEFS